MASVLWKSGFHFLGWLVLLTFFAFFAFVVVQIWQAEYYQLRVGKALNHQLGFRHGSGYLSFEGRKAVEVFTLENITSGGIFDQAGVRSGDIPLSERRITDFYRLLHQSRGTTVTFTVVDGGNGPDPERRIPRTISVLVP